MSFNLFDSVKRMQEYFGIDYKGPPRVLPQEEFEFRKKAILEELEEYETARENHDLAGQLDALVDLVVFALGAAEKHGFDFTTAFKRVQNANIQKELVASAEESKRGHSYDLKKPDGWIPPYHGDLISIPSEHRGILILDGPDCCGKTSLAEHLVSNYGAHYIHATWSPDIEKRMGEYMTHIMWTAIDISQRQLVVVDRHWLSSLVYGDVYRTVDPELNHLYTLWHDICLRFPSARNNVKCILLLCLPNDIESALFKFNDIKTRREEMYDDVSDIFYAFKALWEGRNGASNQYVFKTKIKYLQNLLDAGGLSNQENVLKYDYLAHYNLIEEYCSSLVELFTVEKKHA